MADGDTASHTPSNADIGENAPNLPLNDGETPLSPRAERMMKYLTTFVQDALEQQRHDIERRISEMCDPKSALKPTEKGKGKVTGDSSKTKIDRVSFKVFRGCGAIGFSGHTDPVEALQWLQNTEKVFRISRVWDEDKVTYATAMFTDRALTWWEATFVSLDEHTRETMTWESFRVRFYDQYCPDDLQKRLEKEFMELKQGNMSVIDYETEYNRKARFAQRFLTCERDRIDHFVDGLRREIRDFVANREIPDYNRAVEYARRREHDLTRQDDNLAPPLKRQQVDRTGSLPAHRSSRYFNPRKAQSHTTPRVPPQAFTLQSNMPRACQKCGKPHQGRCNTDRSTMKCYCCGEVGHIRISCPQKDNACYSCGTLGHRQRDCPRMKRDESKASVQRSMTIGTSVQKEVPKARARAFQITAEEARNAPDVVTGIFFVNSRPARILFDSGATNSFVSHYYV